MKTHYAYIRVSTVKQGEKGSSLQEQRAAIEAYAQRFGLTISEWFEEQETAAKLGRPVFTRMLRALDKGHAAGVITHKIDRSARNLKDWAALGELLDRGIELHFAHESIDLNSRGGRLSADIQAVIAADFIRNLRDEVRKGFYGRLKQGLYPLRAPIGYLDAGGGQPKRIDPLKGQLITTAFDLYATGNWSLDTLAKEMHGRGLRNNANSGISLNGWSTILNNPFYVGLVRIRRTGEMFQGVHSPLVHKSTFDAVRAILRGRLADRVTKHRLRYRRLIRCASCSRSLIGERRKGHTYYRCHTSSCPSINLREELISAALQVQCKPFELTDEEWDVVRHDMVATLQDQRIDGQKEIKALALNIAAVDERLDRLTDAYIDKLVERDLYLQRKAGLLDDRASFSARKASLEAKGSDLTQRAEKNLGLAKTLGILNISENDEKIREILKYTTSDLIASPKKLYIAWRNPFLAVANRTSFTSGGPYRGVPRTFPTSEIAEIIIKHSKDAADENDDTIFV
jgi:site-specific DNA recombinase